MDLSNCASILMSILSDYTKFINYLESFCLIVSCQSEEETEWLTREVVLGCDTGGAIMGEDRIDYERKRWQMC